MVRMMTICSQNDFRCEHFQISDWNSEADFVCIYETGPKE